MSFWKKLFGRDFEESVAYGEDLLASGRTGEARLEFEAALSKSKGASEDRIAHVRKKIAEARDVLALEHFEAGKVCIESGELDGAFECFETALQVTDSEDLRRKVQKAIDELDAADAREAFEDARDMTEAERFQVLTGGWEDERADELESYGDAFQGAFISLHDGAAEKSVEGMQEILANHKNALFLHLELGLALRTAGKIDEAREAVGVFLKLHQEEEEELRRIRAEAYEDDEDDEDEDDEDEESERVEPDPLTPNALVQAHATLAEISLDLDDHEAAEKELRALTELLPEKSGPYVSLGAFLRNHERYDEAMEVLEVGRENMGEMRPDMTVLREIGLTQRAQGDNESAIDSLKAVLDYQAGMDDYNFDPNAAVPLAEILEEEGERDRAADLYRHLAAGTHAAGHFSYNKKAGLILLEGKQFDVARRYLTRAVELAPNDEERASVEESLAEIHDK